LTPLLRDPVRTVRIEAAEVLAAMPRDLLSPDDRNALTRATDEYGAAQNLNGDRPESHLNLALMCAKQQKFDCAQAELRPH
jgi:hypothetical protein